MSFGCGCLVMDTVIYFGFYELFRWDGTRRTRRENISHLMQRPTNLPAKSRAVGQKLWESRQPAETYSKTTSRSVREVTPRPPKPKQEVSSGWAKYFGLGHGEKAQRVPSRIDS